MGVGARAGEGEVVGVTDGVVPGEGEGAGVEVCENDSDRNSDATAAEIRIIRANRYGGILSGGCRG